MSDLGVSALTTSAIGVIKGITARHAYIQDPMSGHTIITLDASMREVHSQEAPATEFPIESGFVIADNFIIKPFRLEMEGFITDTPVNPIAAAATSLVSAVLPPSGLILASTAVTVFNAINGAKSPSAANFLQFLTILQNKRPVNVYTTLSSMGIYPSMWLASIRVTREAKSGNSLEFTANFVQVIVVQAQTVNVQKSGNNGLSSGQANTGKQQLSPSNIYSAAFQNGVVSGTTSATSISNTIGIGQ